MLRSAWREEMRGVAVARKGRVRRGRNFMAVVV
jgi:hypothetical protein